MGRPPPLGEWFARLLHGSLVATVTDNYEDFGVIGRRALDAVASRRGRELFEDEREAILATLGQLPPHPEVLGALKRLRSAGFPLATLTNSSGEAARRQLDHAGLTGLFDHILSVEEVRRYKPSPEPYRMAASRLGVNTAEMRMVAAHDWDVWGAMQAGCAAAFVARGGAPFQFGEVPDIVGEELATVAEAIVTTDRARPLGR